jgi:ABC-type multidrug transport system ATPase subunit
MEIVATDLGKKFGREWIFKNFDFTFNTGEPVAITGPNGSGKSTLIQVIAGMIQQNIGMVTYFNESHKLESNDIYKHLSFSAPYLELIEEFTLIEFLHFHVKFKPLSDDFNIDSFIERLFLENSRNKQIKFFSSGMKQRLKLGLSLFGRSSIVLLDEPTSNMDHQGIEWYKKNIKKILDSKLIIICSNQHYEYDFCNKLIDIQLLK